MDRSTIKICRALILNRNESVMVLLRICRWQKYLDGSRSCRESIDQTKSFSMDRETIEKLSRWILEISMDWNCANFYREKKEGLDRRESVEDLSRSYRAWRKGDFQRREKHIKMNATSKQLKHRYNQHIKLSKTSLNKKNAKYSWIQKHTHTHITILTNFIFQKQVKIV